ncbi:chemotaxis protein CheX [Clostridium saccharobutylicum]|uniref:CheC domain protein n=1 Tax=Clostridium saccharobutylicum DSM 13864 TaxID=1345695 RepID=U5MW76_CLOSA|nr:chemotaxis protein CheX [Clostridium saccharobutylicum]AGX45029.1 CheC domain protein [Clostridium saccharobutylicum DSM 13864]AQR92311.1 CheY-P phosphatase CheX [Clostridium saccharobutylicum]AQS02213.1 CheY-P phosphatase CheX [Clostridium saccharobutylicum]AQS16196.1 CheY-P phosphatase CheX [Clostridium saccharobutylicum]MBA2903815.1 chemotaxis protein CheX [Clostridium saccharobutylicum]
MVVNYINPIIDSFKNVMPQLGLNDIKENDVKLKERLINSPGVVIIIGLMGDIKGNIIYGINEIDAKKIASVMMMGMPVEEFDELAQSAISELINMLTANVATNFSQQNVSVNISTPTLIYGKFTANASSDKVICIPMNINEATIEVNISLEKNTI